MQGSSLLRPVVLGLVVAAAMLLPTASANAADQIAFRCNDDLCVVNPDSGNPPTNLTNTGAISEWYPSWSPDGTRLAYGGHPPGPISSWDTYVINVASPGTAIQVTNTLDYQESDSYPPVWSPGGTRIASRSHPNASNDPLGDEIVVSNADGTGGDLHVGSGPGMADEAYPSYSPDGSKIMFARDSGQILTASSTIAEPGTAVSGAGGFDPKWSPDGTRVVTGYYSGPNNWVRVSRVDGTGTPVTLGPGGNSSTNDPEWSPDGTKIMFQQDQFIRIYRADGTGTPVNITTPRGIVLAQGNSWSPDGTRVAFVGLAPAGSTTAIYVANADGTGTARVVANVGNTNGDPTWKPDPNAQPPVDPPVNPTRPPVTISLANFRNPVFTGGYHYMTLAGIACIYGNPGSIAAGCKFDANAATPMVAPAGKNFAAKKKLTQLGKGSASLAYGESGELRITFSKKGQKFIKKFAGKKLKIEATIDQRVGDDPVVSTKKTFKVKVPKLKKGKR